MRKIPELLAPAGGFIQLKAAVENGADAVYLGGKLFNARMNAGNFGGRELREAVSYAHIKGTKIHMTMNTLLTDQELRGAVEQAFAAYEAGVDALIIQDLGVAAAVHRALPEMELHLSTQGTVYNTEGVRQAAELGFSRVVLAREVSLEQMREIASQVSTEIEVFVHGAICICYSGQCHMSREMGGRSGNRGACAQPCRLPFQLLKGEEPNRAIVCNGGALLSPKDMCTLDYLPQIAEAGVASLKIEGRMKSPEYVAAVTSIYRKYLDLYRDKGAYTVESKDRHILNQVFNRGGFSSGYLLENPGALLMSGPLSKHQGTFLGVVAEQNPKKKQLDIRLEEPLNLGDGIEIRSKTAEGTALPGNVITYMKKGGQLNDFQGQPGDTVTVGDITGFCRKGDEVYKITDKLLMEELEKTYEANSSEESLRLKKRPVQAVFRAKKGEPATLILVDDSSGQQVQAVSRRLCEEAKNRPLTPEGVRTQLEKTGGTEFRIEGLQLDLDEKLSLPVSALNSLRREALEALDQLLKAQWTATLSGDEREKRLKAAGLEETAASAPSQWDSQGAFTASAAPKLSVYLYRGDLEAISMAAAWRPVMPDQSVKRISRLYLPFRVFLDETEEAIRAAAGKMEVVPYLPVITKGSYDTLIRDNLDILKRIAVNHGIAIGNLGWISAFAEGGAEIFGDFGLNLYNSMDFQQARRMGLSGSMLSHEWDGAGSCPNTCGLYCEMAVGGCIPLMVSAHCVVGDLRKNQKNAVEKCGICTKEQYFLKDRKNKNYRVLSDKTDCSSLILSDKLGIDKNKYRWCLENSVEYMRIYGIDKRIFCRNTLP